MKITPVLRLALIFVVSYLIGLGLLQISIISSPIYYFLRSLSTSMVSIALPSADISSQLIKGKSASEIYLVYGNPILIERAKEEAKQSGQKYATIPTKSMEIHFFEMFIVPWLFIISLFMATAMSIKDKTKGLLISTGILILYTLIKIIILTLFEISNSRIGVYEFGDSSMNILNILLGVFSLGFAITLGFVCWLIWGFRKSKLAESFRNFF